MPESGRIRTGTIPPLPLEVCLELVEFPLELTAPESVALRILVTSYPVFGHFHPLAPLALAARAVGHDVRVATGPDLTGWVERCGLHAHPVGLSRCGGIQLSAGAFSG